MFFFQDAVYFHAVYCLKREIVTDDLIKLESRDNSVVRALASHQRVPGSIPVPCHMWVESVVGSRFAPRVFLRVVRFSFLNKHRNIDIQILICPG